MLTSREHRQVKRDTMRARNAAARANRAAPVHLVRVKRVGGNVLLAAQSRSTLGVAYELSQDDAGRWQCTCDGFGWRGRCSHVDALSAPAALLPALAPDAPAVDSSSTAGAGTLTRMRNFANMHVSLDSERMAAGHGVRLESGGSAAVGAEAADAPRQVGGDTGGREPGTSGAGPGRERVAGDTGRLAAARRASHEAGSAGSGVMDAAEAAAWRMPPAGVIQRPPAGGFAAAQKGGRR